MSVVYLLPLGTVDDALLRALERPLHESLHAECIVMNETLAMQRFFDATRNQYNSTKILHHMKDHVASPTLISQRHVPRYQHSKKFLGITAFDLFIPILTFVFGEAELDGDVAIVSYHRLSNESYGLPPNRQLLIERLIKESLHELGHASGLVHCQAQECVMHASTYVEDIDLKGNEFCSSCSAIISTQQSRFHNPKFS
jgi:archaemetzincin